MDRFALWLEADTWASVPRAEPDEVVRAEWLYRRQPEPVKRLMDQMRAEDANYLKNLAGSVRTHGFKQPVLVRADYAVDDGLHRLIVALDNQIEDVPVKHL